MNMRQEALLQYIHTIFPHVRGSRSVEEALDRVIKCVREDSDFVLRGLFDGFLEASVKALERKGVDAVGQGVNYLGKVAGDWLLKRRGKK